MKNINKAVKNASLFFIIFSLLIGFFSCKTTQELTDNSENTIQDEIAAPDSTENEQNGLYATNGQNELAILENDDETLETDESLNGTENQEESEQKPEPVFEFREQKLFYSIKYTYDYEVIGEDLDYKIIVDDENKRVIIQFEESDSDQDWQNNCKFIPWPLKLDGHTVWTSYGYAKIYKSSRNIPFNEFYKQCQLHPDYKIVIWGWSLGSAMAKITARHFTIRTGGKTMIDELTTFGDVKCWSNPFFSVKKYCKRIREYVAGNDLITWCIPFYRRDVTCKVGDKFNFKQARESTYYHTHYEDYDYSEWE